MCVISRQLAGECLPSGADIQINARAASVDASRRRRRRHRSSQIPTKLWRQLNCNHLSLLLMLLLQVAKLVDLFLQSALLLLLLPLLWLIRSLLSPSYISHYSVHLHGILICSPQHNKPP